MKNLRTPFFGMPEDAGILSETPDYDAAFVANQQAMRDHWTEQVERHALPVAEAHPDYVEKGTEMALGFMPHRAENRTQRRAAVANWVPPKQDQPSSGAVGAGEGEPGTRPGDEPSPATPAMPTRRELWLQRQKQRRGKLDPELRKLQRERLKTRGT